MESCSLHHSILFLCRADGGQKDILFALRLTNGGILWRHGSVNEVLQYSSQCSVFNIKRYQNHQSPDRQAHFLPIMLTLFFGGGLPIELIKKGSLDFVLWLVD